MKNKDLDDLKTSIGFKSAFKATLGFYVAQFIATFIGLISLGIFLVCIRMFFFTL